jgi:hypothetical protein
MWFSAVNKGVNVFWFYAALNVVRQIREKTEIWEFA